MILDHFGLTASDFALSRKFFESALAPLGIRVLRDFPGAIGMGRADAAEFWLGEQTGEGRPGAVHLAFVAEDRAQVDAFHQAALAVGGRDNGAPGLRPQYHESYYAAFVIGPDGHNVEAVCQQPV